MKYNKMIMVNLPEHKKLYLLRHGDTGFSGRYIGTTDVPINASGEAEISEAAESLATIDFQRVICSPMLRCKQSLELLSVSCSIEYNSLLAEVDFGLWENKTFTEVVEENQSLVDLWVSNYADFCFPEGESIQLFLDRLSRFLVTLSNMSEKRLLLVTHGGVIRHMLCLLLSLPSENYLSFDIKTGKYCSLDLFTEGATLTGLNL